MRRLMISPRSQSAVRPTGRYAGPRDFCDHPIMTTPTEALPIPAAEIDALWEASAAPVGETDPCQHVEFARRVADLCAEIADRSKADDADDDPGAAIRAAFRTG